MQKMTARQRVRRIAQNQCYSLSLSALLFYARAKLYDCKPRRVIWLRLTRFHQHVKQSSDPQGTSRSSPSSSLDRAYISTAIQIFQKYSLLLTLPGRKWLEALLEAFEDEDPEVMLEHMASGLLEGEHGDLLSNAYRNLMLIDRERAYWDRSAQQGV